MINIPFPSIFWYLSHSSLIGMFLVRVFSSIDTRAFFLILSLRGANSGKTVDSRDGRNSRPTRWWRRAAPREGKVQPLGYTVKYKLCRNLETSASAAAPGGLAAAAPATRRLHRRSRLKPAAPERPCLARVRIRRATVRPSGPPGKLRPTVARTTGGARTRESPPPASNSLKKR